MPALRDGSAKELPRLRHARACLSTSERKSFWRADPACWAFVRSWATGVSSSSTLVADMSRSSGLARLVTLGEQVTLRGPEGGLVAAAAAQDEGDDHGERGARDRPGDVDPVAGEGGGGQVGPEGAGRVHRGARDGAAPQAGQGNVATDPEGADDADVLRA